MTAGKPVLDVDLSGRWCVVSGASRGIGAEIASTFVAAGANVVLVARGMADVERFAGALRDRAGESQRIESCCADVADPDSVAELFAVLGDRIPQIDVFVANAGTGTVAPFLEMELELWNEVVAVNLTGTMLCCQQAARRMLDSPSDDRAILVVSSVRALRAGPGRVAYSATKAAVNQMVRVASSELAPHGIRVNALSPGITDTPFAARYPDAFRRAVASVPMGRPGRPADMAAAALFLCSPAARFITGANLVVDGGEVVGE